MTSLILNSLFYFAFAGVSADFAPEPHTGIATSGLQLHERVFTSDNGKPESNTAQGKIFSFVEPSKEPLILEPGRSRLLHFPAGIRRTALSNKDAGDVVQVGPDDLLVMGKKLGVTMFTVWPARLAAPTVIVLRVERKLGAGLQ